MWLSWLCVQVLVVDHMNIGPSGVYSYRKKSFNLKPTSDKKWKIQLIVWYWNFEKSNNCITLEYTSARQLTKISLLLLPGGIRDKLCHLLNFAWVFRFRAQQVHRFDRIIKNNIYRKTILYPSSLRCRWWVPKVEAMKLVARRKVFSPSSIKPTATGI